MQTSIILAFGVVLLVSVVLSLFASRQKPTIQAFFWGDRKLSPGLVASLILTSSFSLNGMLYQTWLGYKIGWWSLAVQLFWCTSFAFLAFNIDRFRDALGVGTMHGIIGARFGPRAALVAALASVLGFAILIGWEVVVGATVLGNVAGVSSSLAVWLPISLGLLAAAYTSMGGLRGNARANVAQNIFKSLALIAGLVALLALAGATLGDFGTVLREAPSSSITFPQATLALGGWALTANFAFSLFWQVVDMSNWQNLSAARASKKAGYVSILVASVLVFVFPGLIGTLIGISLSSHEASVGAITDANVLNRVIEVLGGAPWLAIGLFAAFGAAMLSTMDGYALAAAQAATWDITNRREVVELLEHGVERTPEPADGKVLTIARALIFVIAGAGALGVGLLVARGVVALFDLVYLVVIAQMSLVGPVLFCLFTSGGAPNVRWGWMPIVAALGAGYLSALIGKTTPLSDAYGFAPVVAIAASIIVAAAVRPRKIAG